MSLTIDLTARKALVSGVTSGIGAGIAHRLAQAGCDVAGCGRCEPSDPGALSFLREVESAGRRAFYRRCDLAEPDAAARWVGAAAAELGGVDILVSNAGRNVFGLMPHPERASESALGSEDGRVIFESILNSAVKF